jgi:hypothetical protein
MNAPDRKKPTRRTGHTASGQLAVKNRASCAATRGKQLPVDLFQIVASERITNAHADATAGAECRQE